MIPLPPMAPPGVVTADALASDVGCFPTRAQYLSLVRAFKDDGYEMCVDLCAVDYLEHLGRPLPEGVEGTRFEVVVNLLSLSKRLRARVRVQAGDVDPEVDSLFNLYPGTEAMEREAFDLFGVLFRDHPDLTRILMPEEWEGHPLRKDYAVGKVPVQFKESPGPR
ncbi:MAG TPA: NADH-quinone oxidoreductase subunit C [Acidimicrobiales bacterium]|nr:NADH-quinone oxidoreductase subunit C [Acidimicrobiales bacterium]